MTPEKVVIQRLNEIKSRLDKGDGDFQTLARLHSADPSGTRGGDLGWLYPGDVPPEMEQQLDKLSVGEISEPIRTPYGWHIFQVLDRRTKSGINERQREQARERCASRNSVTPSSTGNDACVRKPMLRSESTNRPNNIVKSKTLRPPKRFFMESRNG